MATRRQILKQGVLGSSVLALSGLKLKAGSLEPISALAQDGGDDDDPSPIPAGWQPFVTPLPVPPILQPSTCNPPPGSGLPFPADGSGAQVGSEAVYHGIAPEFFDPRYNMSHPGVPDDHRTSLTTYQMSMQTTQAHIFGAEFPPVEMYGYDGHVPGPTVIARFKEPVVIRHTNNLPVETSVHLHGGHNPAHSDGYPHFYVLPGHSRDYFYTNIAPRDDGDLYRYDNFDTSEAPSTLWYHDHGMDITGHNVAHGLAGFYLVTDEIEEDLMDPNREGGQVLPNLRDPEDGYGIHDFPLMLQDQRLTQNREIFYDLLDHNGRLGDLFLVNGAVQPVLKVKRRKYRFRILNASNARWYAVRLSTRDPFLLVATDTWLLPKAQQHKTLTIAQAQRRDIIIDFTNAPSELFLENIMEQTDGRSPDGINPREKVRLLKFEVEPDPAASDLTIATGTRLRKKKALKPEDVTVTRLFEFVRQNGAWKINDKWFSPRRSDAVPSLESTERWILKNGGGGWSHPIHIHLSASQVQRINGSIPPRELRHNSDTMALPPNGMIELLIRFGTFTGPFVFHCHVLEHEDMRMMAVFDPRPEGEASPFNGVTPCSAMVSGLPDPEPHGLFSESDEMDRDTTDGDGVGNPQGNWTPAGGGVAPSPDGSGEDLLRTRNANASSSSDPLQAALEQILRDNRSVASE
ncbi:multicopper oxidase family protein [Microbulbifer sp. SA54]|uniref:multicopper oxidase family protein n=1 Tax=Microbulbifer sp. SA54 TaxID=3401577 RepID=UPI003AAEE776